MFLIWQCTTHVQWKPYRIFVVTVVQDVDCRLSIAAWLARTRVWYYRVQAGCPTMFDKLHLNKAFNAERTSSYNHKYNAPYNAWYLYFCTNLQNSTLYDSSICDVCQHLTLYIVLILSDENFGYRDSSTLAICPVAQCSQGCFNPINAAPSCFAL